MTVNLSIIQSVNEVSHGAVAYRKTVILLEMSVFKIMTSLLLIRPTAVL